MPNPNPSNYISGFCHRLHCRDTEPPRGESCESEIYLQESQMPNSFLGTAGAQLPARPQVGLSYIDLVNGRPMTLLLKPCLLQRMHIRPNGE